MKMTFPSLQSLVSGLVQTFRRFPLALAFSFLGTFAALKETFLVNEWNDPFWIKIILCSALGLVFGIFISIYAGTKDRKGWTAGILNVLLLGLLVLYFCTFPEYLHRADWYRFFLLAALGHLAVSMATSLGKGSVHRFWHYNKTLFLRFLTAVLYSAVLFAGICVAILALNELFQLNITDEIYFRLWLVIAGIFNTFIFLAGIPEYTNTDEYSYPKGLKVFTQFVLIPIISLYILILLAYELKIIIQWELPNGWVANLIIAFAIFGILSLLLVYPVKKDPDNKWIAVYCKVFYWIMFPLVVLLFVAIGIRISNYGFTEERFWVLATGVWLLFIALYFTWSKKENIKLIPASLIVVILVTLLIGAPVCIQSQQKRFIKILNGNHIMEKGKVIPPKHKLSLDDRQEITSIVHYLYEVHGSAFVQPFFNTDLSQFSPTLNAYYFTDSVLNTVGIEAARSFNRATDSSGVIYFNFYSDTDYSIETTGYDHYLSGSSLTIDPSSANTWHIAADTTLSAELNKGAMLFKMNDKTILVVSIDSLVKRTARKYGYDHAFPYNPDAVSLVAEDDLIKVKLIIRSLRGKMGKGKIDYRDLSLRFSYLIKFK